MACLRISSKLCFTNVANDVAEKYKSKLTLRISPILYRPLKIVRKEEILQESTFAINRIKRHGSVSHRVYAQREIDIYSTNFARATIFFFCEVSNLYIVSSC